MLRSARIHLALSAILAFAPTVASGLEAADLCTGDPCVITGGPYVATDPFTALDFEGADVVVQATIDFDSNSVDILAGSLRIEGSGRIRAQEENSFFDGGSINIQTTGDIQLVSNNLGGSIVANGCSGGSVVLESITGSITGTRGVNANRTTTCLSSGEGGFIELTAATVDLSGDLRAIGGLLAIGGTVSVNSSGLVRLGLVNVSGGEGDAGTLSVIAGGAVTLDRVDANSTARIGIGGTVTVQSSGPVEVLGNIDALGGLDAIEGDDGGSVTLDAGTPIQREDVRVAGRIRVDGRGPEGSGGFINIDGAQVTIEDPLIATGGVGVFTSAGTIDVVATELLSVEAAITATQGGSGIVILQSGGDLDILSPVDAGGSSGTDGGDVTVTAGGALNVSNDVRADGNGLEASGGSIFVAGCDVTVPTGVSVDASNDTGSVEFAAGQQLTIAGTVSAGATFGSITLRHRRPSVPPDTSGASFSLTPSVGVDATIPPCAICSVTGDADSDGVDDSCDRCTGVGDPSQADTDGDGFGNACDCDFDQTGTCGISDFSVFQTDFASSSDGGTGTDMDDDGVVGIGDFNLFLDGFTSAVPGPSAMSP